MNFAMRPSRVLRRLRAGQVANIFKVNLADPRVCEIAASFGFDAIRIQNSEFRSQNAY